MHFWILYNNGRARYVKARTKAQADEVEKRLEFEPVKPDDIAKAA